jgi:hypothetical protein
MGEKQVKYKMYINGKLEISKEEFFSECKKWEGYSKKWMLVVFVPTLVKVQGKGSKIVL